MNDNGGFQHLFSTVYASAAATPPVAPHHDHARTAWALAHTSSRPGRTGRSVRATRTTRSVRQPTPVHQAWWIWMSIGLLTLVVLLPASPQFTTIPTRDPGVFLYIGDQILDGKIPYRDIWDHKPPLVFYINALGLWLTEQSFWGVWIIELVFLFASGAISFVLLKRVFGFRPAVAALLWLIQLGQLLAYEGGNFTEEYALVLQFAALYWFWRLAQAPEHRQRTFALWIGLAGGTAFFLKQTLIGLWLAMLLYLGVRAYLTGRWQRHLRLAGIMGAGALSVTVGVIVYFWQAGAFGSLWEAAFAYNFAYSGTTTSLLSRLQALLVSLVQLMSSGIIVLGGAGWAWGLWLLRHAPDRRRFLDRHVLLALALFDLPIELFLLGISGRIYPHYSILWLPALAVLTAFFVQAWPDHPLRHHPRLAVLERRWLQVGLVAALVISTGVLFFRRLSTDTYETTQSIIADYVEAQVDEDDTILVWGADTQVHFATDQPAPTRYVYQYPLYTRDYQDEAMIEEFLLDLQTERPVLIIDGSGHTDKVPPLSGGMRDHWIGDWGDSYSAPPDMDEVFDYIDTHYEQIATLDDYGDVYRLGGDQGHFVDEPLSMQLYRIQSEARASSHSTNSPHLNIR